MKVGSVEVIPAVGTYTGDLAAVLGKYSPELAKRGELTLCDNRGSCMISLGTGLDGSLEVYFASDSGRLAREVMVEFQSTTGIRLQQAE